MFGLFGRTDYRNDYTQIERLQIKIMELDFKNHRLQYEISWLQNQINNLKFDKTKDALSQNETFTAEELLNAWIDYKKLKPVRLVPKGKKNV